MDHRIRVAGLVHHGNKILLIKQQNHAGTQRWALPGGRMEHTDASIFEGVEREVFEETGLRVKAGKLRFLLEYAGQALHIYALTLIMDCHLAEGESVENINLLNNQPDDGIHDVAWMSRAELEEDSLTIGFVLSNPIFWDNMKTETDAVIYLGRHNDLRS